MGYKVLTEKQLDNLNQYQHKAAKTTLETWMCNNISGWMEKNIYPDYLTPNFVTLVGQVP